MNPYILLLASIFCIGVGDIFAKQWVKLDNFNYVAAALGCYACGSICYFPVMREKGLIISTLFWTLGTLFVGILIGFSYREPLTTSQVLGIAFGIISIILLSV